MGPLSQVNLSTVPSDTKYIIRTSDRLAFKRCRRAWDLGSKLRQDYEPNKRARPLDFGTAIHAGLQAYYDPRSWHDKDVKEIGCIFDFENTLKQQRKEYEELMGPMDPAQEEEWNEDWELGHKMLQNYFLWAPKVDKFTPVQVEIEFEVPVKRPDGTHLHINNLPVMYQGRLDLLLKDEYGDYWILDHKTTAQFGSLEWLAFDEQCKSYAWAIQEMLNIQIAGVIYSQLRKKAPHEPQVLKSGKLSVNKQQDTTYEIFIVTCEKLGQNPEQYQDYLDHLLESPKVFFRREAVRYNQAELRNMGVQIFQESIEMLNSPQIYPTGGNGCNFCDFRAPCLAMNEDSEVDWVMKELYHKRGEQTNKATNPAKPF